MLRRLLALFNCPGAIKYFSNISWMLGEQVVRMAVGVFVSIWIARQLGPAQFGELSYAVSYVSLFGIVASLGLNRILVRELVADAVAQDSASRLMSTVLAMRMVSACAMYILCFAGAWFFGEGRLALIGLIAGGLFFSASDCIDLFFQSKVQSRVVSSARLVSFSAATLIRIFLLFISAPVEAFATVVLLEYAMAALALHIAYRRRGAGFSGRLVDCALAYALLRESWPEILAGFSGLLFMRLDQVMLQHMVGASAVGTFAVAARLSELWYFIPSAIVATTFPNIVAQRAANPSMYMQRIQILMVTLVTLSYLAVLFATFLAIPVILYLYGPAYRDSADILVVHIWCGVFVAMGLTSGSWIMAEKKVRLNLYRNVAGAAVNVLFNFLLIPRYGAMGAAYATLSAFIVAYFLFDMFAPSMKGVSRLKWRALAIAPALIWK